MVSVKGPAGLSAAREVGMERPYRYHTSPRIVMGLIVIAIGIVFTLDKLGYVHAGSLWEYWPVFLIAAGLDRIIRPGATQRRAFGAFVLLLGVWFLLSNLDLVDYHPFDLWPILLVLLGGFMVWRALAGPAWGGCYQVPMDAVAAGVRAGRAAAGLTDAAAGSEPTAEAAAAAAGGDTSPTVSATAVLGGVTKKCVSRDFRGGDLTAIMGGCELDLRQASIASREAVLDTFALWGGVEIKVPEDWTVVSEGAAILGAFEDNTHHTIAPGTKVLLLRGAAIMGGVEVKN